MGNLRPKRGGGSGCCSCMANNWRPGGVHGILQWSPSFCYCKGCGTQERPWRRCRVNGGLFYRLVALRSTVCRTLHWNGGGCQRRVLLRVSVVACRWSSGSGSGRDGRPWSLNGGYLHDRVDERRLGLKMMMAFRGLRWYGTSPPPPDRVRSGPCLELLDQRWCENDRRRGG
jgi:hypothetical protein